MIGAVSGSLTAAPLRPITVKPLACSCMACAPQRVLASPAPPVGLSAPAVAPALNVTANDSATINTNAENETTASGLPKPKNASDQPAGDEKKTSQTASGRELTPEERAQVAKLQARDREVRAHEQAHAAAGGALAGAPSYTYQTGPDGKQYAVGGEVPIRASASSSNPRQAIAQLQQVARAATAPAQPSGQDRAVAAQARAQIAQLQAQLAQEAQAKAQEALESTGGAEKSGDAAPAPSGLPKLPDLPEIAARNGRASNTTPPGLAHSDAAPRGIGANDANPLGRGGVATLVRRGGDRGIEDASPNGGPMAPSQHNAGPIAAYQPSDSPRAKPLTIIGRIVNLNA